MLGWRDRRPRPRDRWAFTTNAGKTRLTKMFQERRWEPQRSIQVTPPLMLAWSTEWQWERSEEMAGWKVGQLLSETALANASLGWICNWGLCCRHFGGIFTCFEPFLCTWLQVGFVVLGACPRRSCAGAKHRPQGPLGFLVSWQGSNQGSLTCLQPHVLHICRRLRMFFSWQSGTGSTTLLSLCQLGPGQSQGSAAATRGSLCGCTVGKARMT